MTLLVKKGNTIFKQNQVGRELYYILSGSIKIIREKRGKQVELAVLPSGSVFGEMALIDGKPRSATAIANEDSSLISISQFEFNRQTTDIPNWYMGLVRVTSENLRKVNEKLVSEEKLLNMANISQLIVLMLKKKYDDNPDESKSQMIKLKDVKKELLEILGINIQPMNKALDYLEKHEMIKCAWNSLTIPNTDRLLNFAKFARSKMSHEISPPLNKALVQQLIKIKEMLGENFEEDPIKDFDLKNFKTEISKKLGFKDKDMDDFLLSMQKIKVILFLDDKGQETSSLKIVKESGKIQIDGERVVNVLDEERFKKMDFS